MYYRRRLLLALLQALGGRAEKMRLHKLLMLYVVQRGKADYHFVPYRFGAFSFQANADLVAWTTRGLMANHEREWELLDKEDHLAALGPTDRNALDALLATYGALDPRGVGARDLRTLPLTALRSEMAARLLTIAQQQSVVQALPAADRKACHHRLRGSRPGRLPE
ncbi:MAG: hypothetical protein IPJ76_18925 [Flavobacteriales bacterium]|nr:MAG: hypothetical protein IPJ76_18925 [Flavobacteriales bacterium]